MPKKAPNKRSFGNIIIESMFINIPPYNIGRTIMNEEIIDANFNSKLANTFRNWFTANIRIKKDIANLKTSKSKIKLLKK